MKKLVAVIIFLMAVMIVGHAQEDAILLRSTLSGDIG